MKIYTPENCGNSPRSLLAIDIAVNLASNSYEELEPLLADTFELILAGSNEKYTKTQLKQYMERELRSEDQIDKYEVLTSISHGKYAAVSSRTLTSDAAVSDAHDLYEFTGASSSAKLLKVMSYSVHSTVN